MYCIESHLEFNKIYLEALVKANVNVKLVVSTEYLSKLGFSRENQLFETPKFLFKNFKSYGVLNRFIMLCQCLYINFRLLWYKKEKIIISGYDELVLALCFGFPPSILINHNNIDGLSNRLKRYAFLHLAKRHTHLVFNNYIHQRILDLGVYNSILKPHGLPRKLEYNDTVNDDLDKIIFIPSISNVDDLFLVDLFNSKKIIEFLERYNVKIVIKGNGVSNSPHLIFTNKFLSRNEYNFYLNKAELIILPYSINFEYRVSGVLHECIANNKKVLMSTIPSFLEYSDFFDYNPFFSDVDELAIKISYMFENKNDFIAVNKNVDKLRVRFNFNDFQ